MKKYLLRACLFLSFSVLVFSCSDYGKKINIEGTKTEVYYKGGATESDARKVADFLKKDGFLGSDKEASIQVVRNSDKYTVRFVYGKDYYDKNAWLNDFFDKYAVRMSADLFDNKKTDIALADKYFKDYKVFPYDEAVANVAKATPVQEGVNKSEYDHASQGGVDFYWKGISAEEGKTITDYIVQNGSFAGGTAEIYITKDDGHYTLRFPVSSQYQNDTTIYAEIEKVSQEIKDNVFTNAPYSFQITDTYLRPIKTFDY
jgi:hypothetical protein